MYFRRRFYRKAKAIIWSIQLRKQNVHLWRCFVHNSFSFLTVFWQNGWESKGENDCLSLKFTLVEITLTRTYSLGQFERKHLKDYWTHIHWFLERYLFFTKKTAIRRLKISDESFHNACFISMKISKGLYLSSEYWWKKDFFW